MTDRRARRRLLSGAALVGVGLLVAIPRVEAQDSLPKAWTGTKLTTPPSSAVPGVAITAEWHHDGKVAVTTWLTTPADQPVGCNNAGEAQLTTSVSTDSANKVTTSSASTVVPCNGTYGYRLDGMVAGLLTSDDLPLSGSIDVAVAPDAVTGVAATPAGGGGSVALSWDPANNPPPDFQGYEVDRQGADGEWTKLATPSPDDHTFTDGAPPTTGGPITYRVLARRSGPHGTLLSDGGRATATATLPTTTTTAAPGTTTPTTPGSTPGTTPGKTGTTGATGTSKGIPTTGPLNKGDTGVGVSAPRLGKGSADFPSVLPGDGTDAGTDFSNNLNYTASTGDGLGAGGESNGLSSAFYEPGSGRGMAVPVATGFVLAAWAFHLRFLARASRPAKVTAPRGRRFS